MSEAKPRGDAWLAFTYRPVWLHSIRRRLAITALDVHEFAFLRTEHHDRWMGFERDAVRGWLLDAGL